jgi:hypothetical protein
MPEPSVLLPFFRAIVQKNRRNLRVLSSHRRQPKIFQMPNACHGSSTNGWPEFLPMECRSSSGKKSQHAEAASIDR